MTTVSNQHSGKIGRPPADASGDDAVRSAGQFVAQAGVQPGTAGVAPPPAPDQALQGSETRERIVVAMMALVAIAVGGVVHVHFGYSIPGSAMAGLLAFAIFMALNGLLVRSAEITRLRNEVARLEHEMARIKTQGAGAGVGAAYRTGNQGTPGEGRNIWSPPKSAEGSDIRTTARAESRKAGQQQAGGQAAPAAQTPASPPASPGTPAQRSQPPSAADGPPAPRYAAQAHYSGQPGVSAGRVAPQAAPAAGEPDDLPQSPILPDARWGPSQIARTPRLTPAQGAPQGGNYTEATSIETTRPARGGAPSPHREAQPAPSDKSSAPAFQDYPAPEIVDVPSWSGTSETTGDALRDAWSFRPSDATQPRPPTTPSSDDTSARAPQLPPVRSVEADLELVQRKIKALADEVNASEALRNATAADYMHGSPAQNQSQPHHAGLDDSVAALRTTAERMKQPKTGPERAAGKFPGNTFEGETSTSTRGHDPEARGSVRSRLQAQPPAQTSYPSGTLPSLDALIPASAQPIAVSRDDGDEDAEEHQEVRSFLPSMDAPPRAKATVQPQPQPAIVQSVAASPPHPQNAGARQDYEPPPYQPASPKQPAEARETRSGVPGPVPDRKLAEIAAAIEASRMDVFLKPIVGLGDYGVAHFEVDVRLKAQGGTYIDGVADSLSVGASDLLALFDIERLSRTARVAEQLEARGKQGSLLSPTAGQSMTDGRFLEAFARTFEERTAISGQLVLTFAQADIAAFGPGTWQALADMNSFGFRFALSDVTHLATDFSALAERGFAFVKLPAEAFLDGLPAGHGMVPPADICRHMAGAGLTLVVESIDDQAQLAKVFGFGALFGQGQLFGGARQITLQSLAERRTAAA